MALARVTALSSRSQPLSFGVLGHFNTIIPSVIQSSKMLPNRHHYSNTNVSDAKVPAIGTSTSKLAECLVGIVEVMRGLPAPKTAQNEIVEAVLRHVRPEPRWARQHYLIGSAAQAVEAECKNSENKALSQEGTFEYYQVTEKDRPVGWSNHPEDLEFCAFHSPARYYGLPTAIPILYMKETGYEYLMVSHGEIYNWNVVKGTLWKMLQPTTLKDLLEMMNTEEHWTKYRHYFWENPATKFQKIEKPSFCLSEHNNPSPNNCEG